MELDGRVALVTGGARGIGRAIAVALARAGCDVAVADVGSTSDGATPYALASTAALADCLREIESCGHRSARVIADVTSAADCTRMVAEVEEKLGGLDILVANAGVIAASPVALMDEAQWDRVFGVNVKGVFLAARAAIPAFERRGGGRIVNIASVAGKTGRAGLGAYCASKAAVISLTQSLAEELGPQGVTANAVCPGYVRTAMWDEVLNPALSALFGIPADRVFEEFTKGGTFLRRDQKPEDIAEAVLYLCRADNVTGITLTVAGGAEVH
jgi:meso-butanediol dehydrogenase/(S,S)-butanediol dehydrogenase/diacetyl reductase